MSYFIMILHFIPQASFLPLPLLVENIFLEVDQCINNTSSTQFTLSICSQSIPDLICTIMWGEEGVGWSYCMLDLLH